MRGPLTYLYCCSYEGENVHDPNPIDVAAQASGEPTFREVGVGPWSQTHPGEPRPDDASSPNYDIRFDSTLLDEGDRRNVLDRYRYWTVAAIKADLDSRGRHDFEVAAENWTHDFNIGSMVRTANAFQARRVHIVGPHKWNRKGALMTELYQHVENHPSITELVECWKLRIAGEIAAAQSQAAAIAFHMRGSAAATDGTSGTAPNTSETMAQLEALDAKIAELQAARVIALDIIPGAVPMETYHSPNTASCFSARKARACPKKRSNWPMTWSTSPNSARSVPSTPAPPPRSPCTPGSPSMPRRKPDRAIGTRQEKPSNVAVPER